MEEVQTTVYRTDDGAEFTDKAKAEAHEAACVKRRENTSYWVISHAPDLTEGRGMYGRTILEVYRGSSWMGASEFVMDYCFREFGRPVRFVQGVSPINGWIMRQLESYEAAQKAMQSAARVGDYTYPAKWVSLVVGSGEAGLVLSEKTANPT